MPKLPLKANLVTGKENVQRFIQIAAAGFSKDPLMRLFITEIDGVDQNADITHSRIVDHFAPIVQASVDAGGEIVEAGSWSGVALWYVNAEDEPGTDSRGWQLGRRSPRNSNVKVQLPQRPPNEVKRYTSKDYFFEKREEIKKQHIRDRPFWLLHILARNPELQTPGMCLPSSAEFTSDFSGWFTWRYTGAISAVVEPYLNRAREEGVPAWLEATNEHARDIYIHFGFRVVDTLKVTRITPAPGTTVDKEKESVDVYAMIYDSHCWVVV
jgi:hypothetical protein